MNDELIERGRLLYRPIEAAEQLGISRTKLYELIAAGEIPAVVVGKRMRIPVSALREWVERRVAEVQTSALSSKRAG
jgi:excisionase family DNA binding protein